MKSKEGVPSLATHKPQYQL